MPPIFKTLASITVWILFINGCLGLILSAVNRLSGGEPFGALIAWAIGVASLVLSVVVIKLRHSVE